MSNSPTSNPSPAAITAAGALSLAVAMGIGRFAFTPMLPLMMKAGQLNVRTGGWLAAANYLGYLLGAISASRIPLSSKRFAVVSLLLTAAVTSAMALPGPPWLWLALRLFAGVFSAWAFVSTSVWCLGALAQLRRASLSGAVYCGVGAGIAGVGAYCLAATQSQPAPSLLWFQLGAIALVLTAPVIAVLRTVPAQSLATMRRDPGRRSGTGTHGLILCYGVLGFGYILPATFLPVLARSLFADARFFGMAWPVFGLTAAASTVAAAWVLSRASRLRVWASSHLIMALGVLLPSVWPSGLAVLVSALLVGGTFMVVTMAGIQEIRSQAHGDATAWVARMTAAFAVGQIAGPVCASLLLYVPAFALTGLNVALQMAAAALILSAAWLWRQERVVQARADCMQPEIRSEPARTSGH